MLTLFCCCFVILYIFLSFMMAFLSQLEYLTKGKFEKSIALVLLN